MCACVVFCLREKNTKKGVQKKKGGPRRPRFGIFTVNVRCPCEREGGPNRALSKKKGQKLVEHSKRKGGGRGEGDREGGGVDLCGVRVFFCFFF